MKSGLIFKGLLLTTLIAIIGTSLKLFSDNQSKAAKQAEICRKTKSLTQEKLKEYDRNGLKEGKGTFYQQVSFKTKPVVPVVKFPEALNGKKWSKVTQSSIKYIGKGGRKSLGEWFSPDYFYLLEVPSDAKGLAFGKLCYIDGNPAVYSIRKWKELENNKISINGKITLEHPTPLPKINPGHILVNTSSNQKDSLGDATEVYFTKERVRIPRKR